AAQGSGRRARNRREGNRLAADAGILDRAPGRRLSGDPGRGDQHAARSHRHELAPAAAARRAHVFPRLQRRSRGPLRQVLGFGWAKLSPLNTSLPWRDRARKRDEWGALNCDKSRNSRLYPIETTKILPGAGKSTFCDGHHSATAVAKLS